MKVKVGFNSENYDGLTWNHISVSQTVISFDSY